MVFDTGSAIDLRNAGTTAKGVTEKIAAHAVAFFDP